MKTDSQRIEELEAGIRGLREALKWCLELCILSKAPDVPLKVKLYNNKYFKGEL